jgi:hypothetical protein
LYFSQADISLTEAKTTMKLGLQENKEILDLHVQVQKKEGSL